MIRTILIGLMAATSLAPMAQAAEMAGQANASISENVAGSAQLQRGEGRRGEGRGGEGRGGGWSRGGDRSQGAPSGRRGDWSRPSGETPAPRAERRAAPPVASAPAARSDNRGGYDGRRYEGRRGGNGFGERVSRDAVRSQPAPVYREGYRDGRRAERRDDRYEQRSAYRDGYRDRGRVERRYDRRDDRRDYRRDDRRGWNNGWRQDRRYDWYGYRASNRHHYRLPRYYSPYRDYSYRRLSVGFYLDSLFFGSNYWINDPWSYRLPNAYGSYRWVRYYDDVLLVDVYTGQVVDVIHNFFW